MKRIALYLITNLAVLLVLSVALRLFGIERILDERGVGLDFDALLVLAAVVGFGGSFISLLMSKWIAKTMTGARIIERPSTATERWLLETVHGQARRAGIGAPEVAIYGTSEVNAFATGWNRDHALVAVSAGLLANMTQEEAEAVLGHEVSHIANGDMVTLALIQGVVNTFVIFLSRVLGYVVDRVVFRVERGHGPAFWLTALFAQLVLGVLASIVVFWFSRRREFRADAGGAQLAGRPAMIAALRRLGLNYGGSQLPDHIKAFGISGYTGRGLERLFMTHPPLEERIAALQHSAP